MDSNKIKAYHYANIPLTREEWLRYRAMDIPHRKIYLRGIEVSERMSQLNNDLQKEPLNERNA